MSDQSRLSNLSALKEIAETLNQSLDLKQALHDSLEIILDILRLKAGWVFFRSEDGREFGVAAHHGLPPALHCPGPAWEGLCRCNSLALKEGLDEAVNIVNCSRIEYTEGDKGDLVYHASVPLETPHSEIGILNVAAADGRLFTDEELELLNAVGNQMGVAIERARIFEQTRAQRLTEQAALLRLSNALLTTQSLTAVVEQIVKVTSEIFSSDICVMRMREPGLEAGIHACSCLSSDQENFLRRPWRDHGAGQAILTLGRSGQIQLQPDGAPDIMFFPIEAGVPTDLIEVIKNDREAWSFWQSLECRSICIAPIRGIAKGEGIGLLVVAHKSDRTLSEAQVHLTNLLANQAALAIEQSQLQEVRLRQESVEKELNMAQEIQHSFLPRSIPELPGWQIATRYKSARQVGGDFYDLIPLDGSQLGIVIADVADKGVPAALVMALSRTLVRGIAQESDSPAKALSRVNDVLMSETLHNRFVTLFYGVLNLQSGEMTFARAGHNPPFHWRTSTAEVKSLLPPGIALGVMSNITLAEETIRIDVGDVILFYTDGVTEAMNGNQEEFTEDRLVNLLRRTCGSPAEAIAEKVEAEVATFVGQTDPSDDFTLVVIKRSSDSIPE